MKNNLGITMVEVVVVIVIMLMIIAFAVNSGGETLNQADITDVYVEMNSMRAAVNSIVAKRNIDETYEIVKGKQYDAEFTLPLGSTVNYPSYITDNTDDWHIVLGKDSPAKETYEESIVREELGLDEIKHTYIVNYETASVELYEPVEVAGYKVRTYEEVRSLAE